MCENCCCEVKASGEPPIRSRLRSPRVPLRPSLQACIHPTLLDPTVVEGINDLRDLVQEIAHWVKPVYWFRIEPVGLKRAAQATIQSLPSIETQNQFRLGHFQHPKASYPTLAAFAVSL